MNSCSYQLPEVLCPVQEAVSTQPEASSDKTHNTPSDSSHRRHDSLIRQYLADSPKDGEMRCVDGSSKIRRVLILDDDASVAESLAMVLRETGFHTDTAYNGDDALLSIRSSKFDFVLADVLLGARNGIDTALLIRSLQPDCRVLLLTGDEYAARQLLTTVRERESFRILAKPFRVLDLMLMLSDSTSGPLAARRTVEADRPFSEIPRQVA